MKKERDMRKKEMIEVWDKVVLFFGKIGPQYWNYFGNRLVESACIGEGVHHYFL